MSNYYYYYIYIVNIIVYMYVYIYESVLVCVFICRGVVIVCRFSSCIYLYMYIYKESGKEERRRGGG